MVMVIDGLKGSCLLNGGNILIFKGLLDIVGTRLGLSAIRLRRALRVV